MLGKIVHLTADALIISAFLAGIKRSTGLASVPSSPCACSHALIFVYPGRHSTKSLARISDVCPSIFLIYILFIYISIVHSLAPQTGSQRISKQAGSLPMWLRILDPFAHLVPQANTSSTSPSSSLAARPTLNDVASSLKRPPLDDRHFSRSLTLFARYNP